MNLKRPLQNQAIIIKIMEYTHMYISISKVKTAQQIQSTADLPSNQSKSKNYIYQLRTKRCPHISKIYRLTIEN